MNTVVIIQARMGSTRLPGKIMADISGKPMLWHVIERVKKAQKIDQIVLATTKNEKDHKTACLAKECGVELYRGNQNDVLDRYFHAANQYKAELIVRITADCPLIDPHIIDKMVDFHYQHEDLDYISMGNPNPCPDGLDTEVFTFQSLDKAFREARLPSEREHVTPYIWKNTEKFKLGYVFDQKTDLSHLRWTVDEEPDLKFVREVYKRLYHEGEIFVTNDVLELLKHEPELMEINQGIMRNEGYLKSISEDQILR